MWVVAALFGLAKQGRESFFAIAAEIDDAAAGGGIARRPFQLGEARHQGRAERAGEMMAPLAPVEAGLADRAARMGKRLRRYLQRAGHETLALGGQFDVLLVLAYQLLPLQALEHLHAEIAGKMIVANPRPAQLRVLRAGAYAHVAGSGGEARKPLQHAGDVGIGEAVIAMAALFLLL